MTPLCSWEQRARARLLEFGGIDRDDRDERQARLELMIREFQDARRRRLVRIGERPVESHTETETKAVLTGPAPSR